MAVFILITVGAFYFGLTLFGADELFASAWTARFALIVPVVIGGAATWLAMWFFFSDSGFEPRP